MSKWTWIVTLVAIIAAIVMVILNKNNIADPKTLLIWFMVFGVIAIAFFVISIVLTFADNIVYRKEKDSSKKDFQDYFDRVNELLLMQGRDQLYWGDGSTVRMYKKKYKIFGEVSLYSAFIATLLHAKNYSIVYYSVVDDDIEGYIGDPKSPKVFNDPFSVFEPVKSDGGGFVDPRYRGGYSRNRTPLIHIGGKQSYDDDTDDDLDDLVNKGEEMLNR